jgi:predicted MFS family arabinose efflux permease
LRASALAFYSLGIPLGSLLGLVIGGQLADAFGWRMAFLVVGLPGVLLASRALVLTLAAGTAASFLSYGKSTWTAIFFQRTHALSAGDTGLWYGLCAGIAGAPGSWLGGWLADRYGRERRRHVMTAPALGMLIAIPLSIAA